MTRSTAVSFQVSCDCSTPGSSICCAGIYLLFDDGRIVDMLYELEVPECPHEAQEQLGIYRPESIPSRSRCTVWLFTLLSLRLHHMPDVA